MPLHFKQIVQVAPTADDVHEMLGRRILAAAAQAVEANGRFDLALSGGSTPEPFYRRLVTDPMYRSIPWDQTHFWVVDERQVPEHDERSNIRMIRETLCDHVPVRGRQVHPMPACTPNGAAEYDRDLKRELGPAGRLDFVLLGMGADGHTASLFPSSPALLAGSRWVAVNDGPTVTPPPRLTMTFGLLNRAAAVSVLVTGSEKSAMIRRVHDEFESGHPNIDAVPITGIAPDHGDTAWLIDDNAASLLPWAT